MASALWEEAESEFFSEAFVCGSVGDRSSLTNTLESNPSTQLSIDTVIHRPNAATGGVSSKILTAGGARKGTRSRSERMKDRIHGLASEDSDGDGEIDDYGGFGPGNGGGGCELLLSGEQILHKPNCRQKIYNFFNFQKMS